MNQEQEAFAEKWIRKIVKPKFKVYDWMPDKEYVVTAALYNWDINLTPDHPHLFALRALDYNFENKHWFTYHLSTEQLNTFLDSLEVYE